jgi:hypothetical protein
MVTTNNQALTDPKNAPDENDQYRNTQYEKFEDGAQGIDKAPGEEPAKGNEDLLKQSQKGKKVDADPTQFSDQPASE